MRLTTSRHRRGHF
ncbi:hypothetical protein KKC1_17140, partial [Calderihabitans maritimus]